MYSTKMFNALNKNVQCIAKVRKEIETHKIYMQIFHHHTIDLSRH